MDDKNAAWARAEARIAIAASRDIDLRHTQETLRRATLTKMAAQRALRLAQLES